MRAITTLGFDADDTLWHNEEIFRLTQDRFAELLSNYAETDHLRERLMEAEERNLGHYGFGVKGFTLSMIETALEVTQNRAPGAIISQLVEAGKDMLAHPIALLPQVAETVTRLAPNYTLVLITKGDLLDQERKLAQSGLGELFDGVVVVSDKTPDTYATSFDTHGTGPQAAMMIGNSMRSDVIPALEAGAWGVHVPYEVTWSYEEASVPSDAPRFRSLPVLSALPALLDEINES